MRMETKLHSSDDLREIRVTRSDFQKGGCQIPRKKRKKMTPEIKLRKSKCVGFTSIIGRLCQLPSRKQGVFTRSEFNGVSTNNSNQFCITINLRLHFSSVSLWKFCGVSSFSFSFSFSFPYSFRCSTCLERIAVGRWVRRTNSLRFTTPW